jgi:hypothetical protein
MKPKKKRLARKKPQEVDFGDVQQGAINDMLEERAKRRDAAKNASGDTKGTETESARPAKRAEPGR